MSDRTAGRPQGGGTASRVAHLPTWVFAMVGTLLAAGLVGLSMTDVGAQTEPTIEIHRMAGADFEGLPTDPLFLAIVGTDDRPGVSGARADAVHVVGVHPERRRATLLDIPRDTYVEIPGHGRRKINVSHTLGGAELVGRTLTQLTGAPIRYVITTNFAGFTNLVDAVGGVTVDVPIPIHDRFSGANFEPGETKMTGVQALAMARARKGVPRGDFTRSFHQGLLLLGALQKVRAQDPGPAQTMRQTAVLMRHLRTTSGVTAADLYELGRLARRIDPADVQHVVMPGTTGTAGGASVVFPTAEAEPLFADLADDVVLQNPPGD